jgi:enoyl-CoA hydratase/carnithine racemase
MERYEHVSITQRDGITQLAFHTNGGPLTWTAAAHRELPEAFEEVGSDTGVKCVIVTGTGDEFCTVLDSASFAAAQSGWDVIWWEGKRLLQNLLGIDVPVIGVVNGPASVHAEIPVLADIVLASERATFSDSRHFQRGGVPGDGVHVVWPHLIGQTRASYFLMTGQVIDAREAQTLGFVNEVLAPNRLSARAWELARMIADRPLPLLRYSREALNILRRQLFVNTVSHGLAVEGLGAAAAAAAAASESTNPRR